MTTRENSKPNCCSRLFHGVMTGKSIAWCIIRCCSLFPKATSGRLNEGTQLNLRRMMQTFACQIFVDRIGISKNFTFDRRRVQWGKHCWSPVLQEKQLRICRRFSLFSCTVSPFHRREQYGFLNCVLILKENLQPVHYQPVPVTLFELVGPSEPKLRCTSWKGCWETNMACSEFQLAKFHLFPWRIYYPDNCFLFV